MGKKIPLALILAFIMSVIGGSQPPYFPNSVSSEKGTITAKSGQLCTSFCLANGDHCVFGTNMDHGTFQVGQVYVNKRHVMKTAWQASTSGDYARWISQYGSVTFNIIGNQLVWGGMNEAGLMISTMSLVETEGSTPDERPPLIAPFWVQYQLDTASTIAEVIDSTERVRFTEAFDHYLVCDSTGECAVIELLEGELIVYQDHSLPVSALSNSTYLDSMDALESGNFWKIEAYGVIPGGAAQQAGIVKGDWIKAVDGTELIGPKSITDYYSLLAQHEVGDEVIFTILRPGEDDPRDIPVTLAPLPEDISRYVLPPDAPIQILSLQLVARFTGDFLMRFATAAEWIENFNPTGSEEAVAYAFEALEDLSVEDTVWSAVFDPANLRVHFRSSQNPQIRFIDFAELDFSCESSPLFLDVHAPVEGDISAKLKTYTHREALEHGVPIATNLWQVDVSPLYVKIILGGIENFACMEGEPSAIQSPQLYLEDHPVVLSPLVGWTGLLIVKQFWPVLVLSVLITVIIILARKKTR